MMIGDIYRVLVLNEFTRIAEENCFCNATLIRGRILITKHLVFC